MTILVLALKCIAGKQCKPFIVTGKVIVVYVGAVAVLFLFVVMMLDISYAEMREGFLQYLPLGGIIGLILLMELVVIVGSWAFSPDAVKQIAAPSSQAVANTEALGNILYTQYVYYFQAAGMILLVAMIGAIVLTHRTREGLRKQKIADQVARRPEGSVEIKKVASGSGV